MMARQVGVERKLAAILCADVYGYSRLMGGDEEATLVTLSAHRKIIDSLIEQHHGRFVNSAGDSGPNQLGIPCQSDAGSLRLPSLLQCYYQSPYACPVRIGLCRGFLALARTRLPCVVASTRRLLVALLRRLLGTDCLGEVKPRQTDGTPRAERKLVLTFTSKFGLRGTLVCRAMFTVCETVNP